MRQNWTAQDCFRQLSIIGVDLTLLPGGKLKGVAPESLDVTPMLPVIRSYRAGLIRILRKKQSDADQVLRSGGLHTEEFHTIEALFPDVVRAATLIERDHQRGNSDRAFLQQDAFCERVAICIDSGVDAVIAARIAADEVEHMHREMDQRISVPNS